MCAMAGMHQVPTPVTPLIGRTAEVSAVGELVVGERAVTLLGVGGIGKTRLAAAVCAEVADRFPGGVWWVDLASVVEEAMVSGAVLAAIGSREVPGSIVERQLAIDLGDQPALLVLDNCEHVVRSASHLVRSLLAMTRSVRILATSREPLGVPGEIAWRVAPLAYAEANNGDDDGDVPRAVRPAAVELFVECARRARPTLALSNAELNRAAEICARLDGIPLAIELAAARCRQFSIERIAEGLDDRFHFLAEGRSALPRHRTLAASLEWSFARLEQQEARAFGRLAVFTGLFTIEAAVHVIRAAGSIDEAEALDVVGCLVDKSLVEAEPTADGSMNYRMLETLRAYALDQMDAGELDSARDAHLEWWLEWLEPIAAMPSDGQLARVAAYEGNLRAALDWSTRCPLRGLPLLARLARVWTALGRAHSMLAAFDALLAPENATNHPDVWLPAAVEAILVYFAGRGAAEVIELTERIDEVASLVGDDYHRLLAKGEVDDNPDDLRALRDGAIARGDRYQAILATVGLADWFAQADPAAATPFLAEATSSASASGNPVIRRYERIVMITAARSRGDLRSCLALARQALADNAPSAMDQQILVELSAAGLLARDGDALREAAAAADVVEWIAPGAAVCADRARHRLALFEGTASHVAVQLDPSVRWPPTTATMWLVGREAIDAEQLEATVQWARRVVRPDPHSLAVLAAIEGAAGDDEDRWHEALRLAVAHHLPLIAVDAFEALGVLAARAESWQEGGRLLAAAARLRDETGYRWRFAAEQHRADEALAAVRSALGDAADACAGEGRERTWHEAAEYARRSRGERRRPRHGWSSLTPTELRVVALVAQGCTNPQIADSLMMGRATVKTHLDHVYAKLGASHRSQLAAEFARRSHETT